jgi:hypothetical protein
MKIKYFNQLSGSGNLCAAPHLSQKCATTGTPHPGLVSVTGLLQRELVAVKAPVKRSPAHA